jgi:hypothetical protein
MLLAELLSGSLIRQSTNWEDLHCDVALELLIVPTVHNSHSTRGDLFENAIVAELLADEMGVRGH